MPPIQSTGGRSGGGRGKFKQANKQLIDSLREACPAHRLNDLESLVVDLKGNEEQIREKISEWWEEPVQHPTEGEWEDVNKRGAPQKKKDIRPQSRGGRGDGKGRGRGGRESRGRGQGERSNPEGGAKNDQKRSEQKSKGENGKGPQGIPPVESVRVPHGAWAKKTEPVAPPEEPAEPVAVSDVVSKPIIEPVPSPSIVPIVPKPVVATSGNVWATKGSAHLIQAEKPLPPPPPSAPVAAPASKLPNTNIAPISRSIQNDITPLVVPTQHSTPQSPAPEQVASYFTDTDTPSITLPTNVLDSKSLMESATSSNAWNSNPVLTESAKVIDTPASPDANKSVTTGVISLPSSVVAPPRPIQTVPDVIPPQQSIQVSKPQEAKLSVPTNYLNMGKWEVDKDVAEMDFGFGNFDAPSPSDLMPKVSDTSITPPTTASEIASSSSQQAAASPARPPPGLTIGGDGMPPMPSNAVLVHELENKLEQVSIDTTKQSNATQDQSLMQQPPPPSHLSHDLSRSQMPGMPQNPYSTQYGNAMGMGYSQYGAGLPEGVNSFGMPSQGAPILGGSQQPPTPKISQPSGGPLQQSNAGGLYGQSTGHAPSNTLGGTSTDAGANTTAGIPPGMPAPNMPYGNPAVYYGQQAHFPMGHNQGGIGYNYYGAQFGNVQSFGYPPAMGQNAGYNQVPYPGDDHGVGNPQHQSGVYQAQPKNNGGGYRGGRHNASNQYQQSHPYPQQHHQGAYGGQAYGIGYHGDHFAPRGAYGGMDPYGMPPQAPNNYNTGFQNDDQYKGKQKGNRSGGLQHFQQNQGPPQPLPGQQTFGLHGQDAADPGQQGGTGSWSNQHTSSWSGGSGSGWQQK